tara:strand:+ start:2730 stop:3407 length:678 start_codon:yes stop_codon:yes gene_type:complete
MAKLTDEEFIKIQEENSEMFNKHYEKIKKLPDNTFVGLPVDKKIMVPIDGMFLQHLRVQMDYLMQSEEPYTVVGSLMKVKDMLQNKIDKKIKYDNYDIAFYCCYALINQISNIAEKTGMAEAFDKEAIFKSVDKQFMSEAPVQDVDPLSAEELAKRMGITIGADGKIKYDEDYIKKQGLDVKPTTASTIESHFGMPAEEVLEQGVNPVKAYKDRKENRQEYYDKG